MKRSWLVLGALCVAGFLLWRLQIALIPVLVALFLAYLLDPLVTRMAPPRGRVPRFWGSLVCLLGVLLFVAGVGLIVVPLLVHQISLLAERLPDLGMRLENEIVPWLERTTGVTLPKTFAEVAARGRAFIESRGVAGQLAGSLGTAFTVVFYVVLAPVLAFMFLEKFPAVREFGLSLVPRPHRDLVVDVGSEIDRAVSGWIRGQIVVMIFQSVCYVVVLSLLRVDYGLLIGLLAGLLAFVPYVGVGVGLLLAVLACLIDYRGGGQLIGVLCLFAAVPLLDGLLVTPRVVGERTGLGPVGVILALLFCGELFGLAGVLLAVPLAATAVIIGRRLLHAWRQSDLYRGEAPS
jgi:predicted PurR-regulated permease PerM